MFTQIFLNFTTDNKSQDSFEQQTSEIEDTAATCEQTEETEEISEEEKKRRDRLQKRK